MYDIVEDHGKTQFANGQRRRDLRVSPEPGMQLANEVSNLNELLR